MVWRDKTWTVQETIPPDEHEPHLKAEYRDFGYRLTALKVNASPLIAESELKSVEELAVLTKKDAPKPQPVVQRVG